MSMMIDAVREDGQPKEEGWPYLDVLPSPASAWMPPKDCGMVFRHAFVQRTTDVSNVFAALDAGQPALFAARISEQFYLPSSDHIIKTIAHDRDVANHALVAVGHGANGSDSVVLIRNSWGDGWADRGHVWVTKDYLAPRLLGIAVPSN